MSEIYIPEGYRTPLSVYEMQRAIEFIKHNFQVNLGSALNLRRVSAPLFVAAGSGLNDGPSASTSPGQTPRGRWSIPWPSGSGSP